MIQGIERQGAALFHSLIANHPFENGNKRTAVLAQDLFFIANGYSLTLSPDEIHDLAVKAAAYRETGLSHDEMLAEIVSALEGSVIPFAQLDSETADYLDRLRDGLRSEACVRV